MGTLDEDLRAVKSVEDKIINNKVANFAYTDKAYTDNDADSVAEYNVDNEQNIPAPNAATLKVNETVLSKGFRAKASSLTRMLVNHFFGRVSYNLNKVNDSVSNLVNTLISHRGTANGLATLDSDGRIPYSQLPESAMEFKGNWNAETNTPTLADGNGTLGDFYVVSVGGTANLGSGDIKFVANDRIIYNQDNKWIQLSGNSVKSVNNISPDNAGNITIPIANSTEKGLVKQQSTLLDYTNFGLILKENWAILNGVTYANGLFVAVGGYDINRDSHLNIILTSTDGRTWEQQVYQNSSSSYPLFAVTYGNGLYVAVGGSEKSIILTSPDGITWTQRLSSQYDSLRSVVYGNGLFVAVGEHSANSATLFTSPDGITWAFQQRHNSKVPLNAVTYGNGLFVAVGGYYYTTGENECTINTSPDGVTWTKRFYNNEDILYGVVYGNGLYVAIGKNKNNSLTVLTSPDGVTWTKRPFPFASTSLSSVTYANGLFTAVGASGIFISSDGINWTKQAHSSEYSLNGITYGNDIYVAVGGSGNAYSTIVTTQYTDAVKVDEEGNMTVPALKSIIARLEALENKI